MDEFLNTNSTLFIIRFVSKAKTQLDRLWRGIGSCPDPIREQVPLTSHDLRDWFGDRREIGGERECARRGWEKETNPVELTRTDKKVSTLVSSLDRSLLPSFLPSFFFSLHIENTTLTRTERSRWEAAKAWNASDKRGCIEIGNLSVGCLWWDLSPYTPASPFHRCPLSSILPPPVLHTIHRSNPPERIRKSPRKPPLPPFIRSSSFLCAPSFLLLPPSLHRSNRIESNRIASIMLNRACPFPGFARAETARLIHEKDETEFDGWRGEEIEL